MKLATSLLVWVVMLALQAWVMRAFPDSGSGLPFKEPLAVQLHVSPGDFWIHALLLFSLLVLMPLGRGLQPENKAGGIVIAEDVAAGLVGLSLLTPPVPPTALFDAATGHLVPAAFLLSLPWLGIRLHRAHRVLERWLTTGPPDLTRLTLDLAQGFPAIGAAWLVAHRAGWTPWHFNPLIVLLTAAHFHHAGFTLPLIAGLQARAHPSRLTRGACLAILAGVPLVAAGITCTHFGVLSQLEPLAVTVLVLGALAVAVTQLLCGLRRTAGLWLRLGFLASGASLFAAMLLALGFGLRSLLPDLALPLPRMWQIHGSLNAFGFGLCGLLAWRAWQGRQPLEKPGPPAAFP